MMRSLVWTFWFALILSIVGTFSTSVFLMKQWNRFVSYSQIEGPTNYPFQILSKEIETALNQNGNLEMLLLNNPMIEFGEVYLVNPAGDDVLGRTLPEKITMTQSSLDVISVKNLSSTRPPFFVRGIESDRGEFFSVVFRLDSTSFPFWNLFKRFGLYWVLFAALIVSGLISWWLAIKITRPIQHLALASDRQGDGDLGTQIDGKILQREDEIGGLARQLQASGTKIQTLLKKQQEFLRDVSHEVRAPLARLQVSAETLELDTNDRRALNQIKQEVQIIDQLVQDLLHLAHFDRPSQIHKIENIPLPILIDLCVERSQMLASRKNVLITVKDIDQRDQSITGVRFLLDRALDNLMNNAIRHSPEYGKIQISCEIDKENCCIRIWDQGEGVSEDNLDEIFEPFFRVDSSRNRQTGGFGLGLSLVKRIAELHEGLVIASNRPNGFEVKLIIPLNTKKPESAPEVHDNKG